MTEAIFNKSGAELRIQDGDSHKSTTVMVNSIEEDMGSVSMATISILIPTGSCGPRR